MKNGFENFKCQRCGNCCKWHGFVRLKDHEVDKIAEFLEMKVGEFLDEYTVLTPDRRALSLTERSNGECCFFDAEQSLCMIQAVKPQQCIDFPQLWNFDGWENECEGAKVQNGKY